MSGRLMRSHRVSSPVKSFTSRVGVVWVGDLARGAYRGEPVYLDVFRAGEVAGHRGGPSRP